MSNITGIDPPVTGNDKATYPTKITNSFSAIDTHDHSPTKGLPIGTAGIQDGAITAAKLDGGITLPTGVMVPFAGTAAPSNWLLCDGSAINRVTYADLFTTIGITFGVGNGTTTFNLPDMRGRVAAGKDDMGGTPANRLTAAGSGITGTTLGNAGGTETHALITAELASHTHTMELSASLVHPHDFGLTLTTGTPTGNTSAISSGSTTGIAGAYSTQNNTTSLAHTHVIDTAGSGTAHNITQPTIIFNYIIRI